MTLYLTDIYGKEHQFDDKQAPTVLRMNREKGELKKLVRKLQGELKILKEEKTHIDTFVDETVERTLSL